MTGLFTRDPQSGLSCCRPGCPSPSRRIHCVGTRMPRQASRLSAHCSRDRRPSQWAAVVDTAERPRGIWWFFGGFRALPGICRRLWPRALGRVSECTRDRPAVITASTILALIRGLCATVSPVHMLNAFESLRIRYHTSEPLFCSLFACHTDVCLSGTYVFY